MLGVIQQVLLWSVTPPELVDFSVNMMGNEVAKKHQKAQHSSELNNRFSVVMSSREKPFLQGDGK